MKRTVFPNEGTYEIDGVFLSKQEAFYRLKPYIGEKQYTRLCEIDDVDESESAFKSLCWSFEKVFAAISPRFAEMPLIAKFIFAKRCVVGLLSWPKIEILPFGAYLYLEDFYFQNIFQLLFFAIHEYELFLYQKVYLKLD